MRPSARTVTIPAIASVLLGLLTSPGAIGQTSSGAEPGAHGISPAGVTSAPSGPGEAYTWPSYDPNLNCRFTDDHPNFKPPAKVLDDCTGVTGTVTSGWWCFGYGANRNDLVTAAAWKSMLDRMNEEFACFRDVMGWPPDKRARKGYYSTIYLFGSGLSTDKAKNTDKGGWMGSVSYKGEIVSPGSIAWIWQNCTGRVLEGLAAAKGGPGEAQTRRLITEFRARQALCDFGHWTPAYKKLPDSNWGLVIKAEHPPVWVECEAWTATCYVATSCDSGSRTLTPEHRTLPGWSGANQIPLTVSGTGAVSLSFQPIGENMNCRLVYRATDGSAVYSAPVQKGVCRLNLRKPVKNNVVIAVICNTDYVFKGDETRKAKHDYRLTLGDGATGTADIHTKWWD